MGTLRFFRRLKGFGVFALFALWSFSPMLEWVKDHWPDSHSHSEIEASRIHLAESEIMVCEHHHEGCPKDCFCPKVKRSSLAVVESAPMDIVYGTAYEECTAGTPKAKSPSMSFYLPHSGLESPPLPQMMSLPREAPSDLPHDPYVYPLLKIPIVSA